MDYLTVPPSGDKAGEGIPPGGIQPTGSTMSELTVPLPLTPETPSILSTTSSKKKAAKRRTSKLSATKQRKGLKVHRQKRKKKTLKSSFQDFWTKLKPQLVRLRKIIYSLTQNIYFDIYIFTIVGLNTLVLVVQTFAVVEIRGEWFFSAMDPVFLCIYLMEAMLKIIAVDIKYFKDCWNDIDLFIMFMTALDFVLSLNVYISQFSSVRTFRILKICKGLRAVRAIRYILTLKVMKNLKEAASTFVLSAESIGAIILLMFSFLCMFAVVMHDIFESKDPKHFGDIFKTIFTLFQLLTLDDWSIVYLNCRAAGAWYIIFFLIIYILVEYFLLLNLVIAVLVDNFQMGLLKRQELLKQQQKRNLLVAASETVPTPEAEKAPAWSRADTDMESDMAFFREKITEKYGKLQMTDREWQLFHNYFLAILAIETTQQQFYSQAATTEKILDTFFETAQDEYNGD